MSLYIMVSRENDRALYAKQPIFNKRLKVIGYELLFRPQEILNIIDGEMATAQLLLNTFSSDDPIIREHQLELFINFPSEWLKEGLPLLRPNCVIEILETVEVTDSVIEHVKRLKQDGFRLALDDFNPELSTAKLLPFVDLVKIDVLNLSKAQVAETLRVVSQYSLPVLAEKVETREMFAWAKKQGFEFFQGYFFARPLDHVDTLVRPNKIATLELLAILLDPDVDFEKISKALEKDPVIVVKILKMVNNGPFRRATKVTDLKAAAVILGFDLLKRWVGLIALTELDEELSELARHSFVLAFAMSAMSSYTDGLSDSECFFIGFLSNIDVFFNQPKEAILSHLPIADRVRDAVLCHDGSAGALLALFADLSTGDWTGVNRYKGSISAYFALDIYVQSESKAQELYGLLV